jgi:hypothetical protein
MSFQKFLAWAFVGFAAFYMVTEPGSVVGATHGMFRLLLSAGHALAGFLVGFH